MSESYKPLMNIDMKKLLTLLLCVVTALSANATVKTVYVNPLQNTSDADKVIAKRLYKKALLGLTKAKTISISSGSGRIVPGSEEAKAYDFLLDIHLTDAKISEAGTISNLINAFSTTQKNDTDWEGKLTTEITLVDAATGARVFQTTLSPSAINEDRQLAIFNATNHYDYDLTDMTDDAFRIGGEVLEGVEFDKKNIVKKVRSKIGAKDGARKNQAYELFKVTGDDRELIGMAKCEQILNADESILSVSGRKGADKVVSDLIQNLDGSYTIEAWSRSRNGFLHTNFQGIDKMFTNEGRPHYMDPFHRTAKPKVAFLAVEINDSNFYGQKDNFEQAVVKGMSNVPTIELVKTIYPNVEAARKAGIDGLIEITIDKVFNTTDKTKEGKTIYRSEILYTIAGIDVANNTWIDMKSSSDLGSSMENETEAKAKTLTLFDDAVQKYSEDLFPVAASIIADTESKNGAVKKASIDIGTDMGVTRGMVFDIYEQRAEGGADSRFLLGEGKVEKEGLTANEAIIKVQGKNDGDKKLFELLRNMDENTQVILISKARYDILDKGLEFLNRTK